MRFFRIYWKTLGGHTHTRWLRWRSTSGFSGGNPKAVMGKCGDLTFVNDEWDAMRELLHHSTVEFIKES